jgi:putative transposase
LRGSPAGGWRRREEAERDLAAWPRKWQDKYPKLCDWVEENIDETLTFYRFPDRRGKHLKSTNMPGRLNEEIKRRTRIVRALPNEAGCLRLERSLAVEKHEEWPESAGYLNMELLKERRKQELLRGCGNPAA